MERMQRRWPSLTREEVQKLFDEAPPKKYAHGGLGEGEYMPPYSDALTGKSYVLQFEDYPAVTYSFNSIHELTMTEGKNSYTDYALVHEAEPGLFFIHHAIKGTNPPRVNTVILDLNTGLVTLCRAEVGNEVEAREMSHKFYFGKIAGYDSYPEEIHHFTSDLVGKAIYWTYHEGKMPPLKHIYSSELYYSYVMQFGDKCWMASNPADFVKINDHQYIFSFLEERQAGAQGLFLINMDTLHDVGCFTGINGFGQFEAYTVGAKGELTTMWTHLTDSASE